MGTHLRPDLDEAGRPVGDTVWAARLEGDVLLGAAWEWIEVWPGVPALRDPNGFLSNIRWMDLDGGPLGDAASIVALNLLAHRCDWQAQAGALLQGGSAAPLTGRLSSTPSRRGAVPATASGLRRNARARPLLPV